MLQPNSRIERFNGIRFYEQDIMYDDYTYNKDIQINLDVDYITPGFGIALMNNEGLPLSDQKEVYLFRFGYREASIIYKLGGISKKILAVPTLIVPPMEDVNVIFSKISNKITLTINYLGANSKILEYILPTPMDKYSIALYSNAGNIVRSMSIASSIPNYWNVNMRNTNGGHILFKKNGFDLINCVNNAEIEQPDMRLTAGKYYLAYESINSDVTCYVIPSGDERLYDADKNLLQPDNSFTLTEDMSVNTKFSGTKGTIKNIHITDNKEDRYIATKTDKAIIQGSYINVDIAGIEKIQWVGTIQSAFIDGTSIIFSNGSLTLDYDNTKRSWLDNEYTYSYDVPSGILTVTSGVNTIYSGTFLNGLSTVTVFKNLDAILTDFSLIRTDGEVINLIVQKTSKRFVPGTITSPIIVIDPNQNPLNLSSSYRIVNSGAGDRYIFTNYEREIFTPENTMQLAYPPSSDSGSVKVYAIPKQSVIHMDKILRTPADKLDSLTMFCEEVIAIKEKDLVYMDKTAGYFSVDNYELYDYIVVDYLKKDSYCVNYNLDKKMYEVEVSSETPNTSIVYDHVISVANGVTVSSINSYRVTDIAPESNQYIVLRKEFA